jgi:2-oxoisovalerate dehydrogenase E1 component beta subunit
MACAPCPKSSSPITSTPPWTSWSARRRGCAIVPRGIHRADHRALALWRGHLRRPDPQPVPEGIFTHCSGIKTIIPSTPYDAKGLLIAAIEDNDPVLFFEPKRLYNGPFHGHYDRPATGWAGHADAQVPEGYYRIDIGKARIVRSGDDLTILTYGTMVHVVASTLEEMEDAPAVDLIDLRSLIPLDIATIEASVKKTGRCLIVHEATRTSGFGAELSALVQERCFHHLEAPVLRVTGFDTPYPHALEWAYFPGRCASPRPCARS